nr:plastocyanin/azurin family copper-binding protein [Vulcanisaeta thermophila]
MRRTWLIIGIVIAVVAASLVALAITSYYYYYYYGYYRGPGYYAPGPWGFMSWMWSWMWGYRGGYYGPGTTVSPTTAPTGYGYYYYGYSTFTIPISEAMNLSMNIPSYAHVIRGNDTIVFTSNDITLVVLAMMGDDAVKMTGMSPPPYAHGDVFVIYGLINPTLVIPPGSVVHVIFINLDDDMYHNFVITTVPPPYPYNVMPYVGMYGGYMGPGMMSMMSWLPPANYNAGYAYGYEYTVVLNGPGTYWYLCTYPGHAEEGMYGEVIVGS